MAARRALLLFIFLAGCGNERLVAAACREDSQCGEGQLCDDFRCVPAESKSCEVVIEGNPILQPSPYSISFGELDVPAAAVPVTLHNIGNCTLTLFEAQVAGQASPFGCDLCAGKFPIEIFPGRRHPLEISFAATGIGSFADHLVILSDDREFPELRVPLHARFLGVPDLRVAPDPVDFGFVSQGRVAKKRVQITNQGTGIAEVVVESVALDPPEAQHFSLVDAPGAAVRLKPMSADGEVLALEVQYHPRATAVHQAELVLATSHGERRIALHGNALTAPQLSLNPPTIDLGKVPLGHTNVHALTLLNEGGAPLEVSYRWGGINPSTDLFATPLLIPPITAGAYTELQVAVTATGVGPINGFIVLDSNDPSRPSVTIPVSAEGIPGPGPEVVKLELTFDNGSDTAFDRDIRNIDLTLEHPYGYVCNKQYPNPTNWGTYGNPSWISFGIKEEPERIVLADAQTDGTFRIMLHYVEDCSALPTELLAGILGISVDALIIYLSGGLIDVNGQDVGKMIEQTCFSRSASTATVRVWVNGAVIKEQSVTLERKGDTLYALDLVRSGGSFSAQ